MSGAEQIVEAPTVTKELAAPSPRTTQNADGAPAQELTPDLKKNVASVMNYEFIDSRELARRLTIPTSWIRDQVRARAEDPLSHVNLGNTCILA